MWSWQTALRAGATAGISARSDDALEAQREEEYLSEKTSSETFVPIDGEPVYTCTATRLNCRAEPNTKATILHQITMLTEVNVLGQDGDFYLCRLDDVGIVYCSVNYLTEGATYAEYDGAVDLRVYLPDAKFESLFASPNNITGSAMYPAVPLMEEKTAEMLKQAFEIFQNDGYTLKVYDAYRPRSAQVKLYDIVQNNKFIANPYTGGSWHQRGRAIDMSSSTTRPALSLRCRPRCTPLTIPRRVTAAIRGQRRRAKRGLHDKCYGIGRFWHYSDGMVAF